MGILINISCLTRSGFKQVAVNDRVELTCHNKQILIKLVIIKNNNTLVYVPLYPITNVLARVSDIKCFDLFHITRSSLVTKILINKWFSSNLYYSKAYLTDNATAIEKNPAQIYPTRLSVFHLSSKMTNELIFFCEIEGLTKSIWPSSQWSFRELVRFLRNFVIKFLKFITYRS